MSDEVFGRVIKVLEDGTALVETTIEKIIDFVGEERFLELMDEMVERANSELEEKSE